MNRMTKETTRYKFEIPTGTWKGWCIRCPICDADNAFDMQKLIRNMALATVLQEIRRLLMDRQPDHGDDDHSNGGVDYKDEGAKRKRESEE